MNPGKSWGYMISSGAEPDRVFPSLSIRAHRFIIETVRDDDEDFSA